MLCQFQSLTGLEKEKFLEDRVGLSMAQWLTNWYLQRPFSRVFLPVTNSTFEEGLEAWDHLVEGGQFSPATST
ncbi:hypothetical protein PoB_005266800 [Plakobranchus ocellatus]|uniref:Uncharacterized protein n=1 Tax=Plakobranchus ocellatus TaxID=259542 RepID=A0AAV4C428_9GAST|nr:hypothetical protein PoB_005266800 [Plakobranchus ocellatus]